MWALTQIKPNAPQPILLLTSMANVLTFPLLAILCLLITHATALSIPRATDSVVPKLPTPPTGSKVVFVGATDPGIIWSSAWQTFPSACSSGTMRAMSAVGRDVSISYVATYNFRGSGIYVNLQSGNAVFQISIDDTQKTFGDAPGVLEPVPANCTYDYSVTDLKDGNHVFKITGLWPSISMDSYWNLGLESLAIIQSDSDSSPSNFPSTSSTASSTIPSRASPAGPPSGTDSNSSPSNSTNSSGSSAPGSTDAGSAGSKGHGGLSTGDIIGLAVGIPGGLAGIITIWKCMF
ncbi:hypothetical protein C8J57DRAFT_629739 [Mycena rebaudengoi]|nr:hypothetical protein C8J57DRAFT_629739 [Mycena rebaudengoi]